MLLSGLDLKQKFKFNAWVLVKKVKNIQAHVQNHTKKISILKTQNINQN